ncbi:hypothetical protein M422DRAFT_272865 [Sphaerobolus stellatus SS14]|uniref:DUF6593 domain-containing protein n=1 Tax=Sphaerobolus stellatus (strain SS14) TaxID=990650 RepID=A0A0C9TW90_SPHS4|nr:hypothetical protein M422DRAFT_272865 [Sphaerobolus stellatus SS14]
MEGAQDLAELHWETVTFDSANLYYRGQQCRMADFLLKNGVFSRSRTFEGSNGMEYKWKCDARGKFTLFDSSRNLLVESHKSHLGILRKARDYSLDVMPAGIPILDDIIVSFIIMRYRQIQRKKRKNGR